jgi:formylmethanofuran dehydrogenase subunit B
MENVVCNGCSLLCDDVAAKVSGKTLNSLGLCKLGHARLETAIGRKVGHTKKVLEKAADILLNAESLLLLGWTQASNRAIEEGLELASTLGGHFASGVEMGPIQAMTHSIHSKGFEIDLEYVRNNGEFIIYWGSDPSESLHRHASRFAVFPRGQKVPEGVESRTIGVIDVRPTETMKMANHRLVLPVGKDAEFLDLIIAELEGKSSIKDSLLGIPGSELVGFVRGLQKSDCTIIFYGSGVINSGNHAEKLTGISKLVQVLRSSGKEAYALPMFFHSNTMGVAKALNDRNTDANSLHMLTSGKFDTSLVIGDDVLAYLPGAAAKALAKTKIVYVGPPGGLTDKRAAVSIHTADSIIAGSETMTRVDMKDIEFKQWKASKDKGTITEVLLELHELVRNKKK